MIQLKKLDMQAPAIAKWRNKGGIFWANITPLPIYILIKFMAGKYVITNNVLKEYDQYIINFRANSPTWEAESLRDRITGKLVDVKKKEIKKAVPGKIKFLEFIYMTQEEYANLIGWYWIDKVKDIIHRMNDYVWSKWDKYKSHYHTAMSWFNQKGIKRIDQSKGLEEKREAIIEKEFVPMTAEQKIQAKDIMMKARNILLSKSN